MVAEPSRESVPAGSTGEPAGPRTEYDAVPYPGYAYALSHPDRLATVAALVGLTAPAIERCRILEIGCGDGANLLPMAYGLPQSRCVGFDLAGEPIARGQALAAALGLTNCDLRQLDLRDAGPSLGEFDYIIAHGIYAWIPPEVQAHLLRVCAECLAPAGVAYVSYNASPGGQLRTLMRDMMRYHSRDIVEPAERIAAARAFATWIGEVATPARGFGPALQEEAARIAGLSDALFYHDNLAPVSTPVAFHDFVSRAAAHGLAYLGESDFAELIDRTGQPEVDARLDAMVGADPIARSQYLDFIKGRAFRQTLLVHPELARRSRRPPADRLANLWVASPSRLEPAADGRPAGPAYLNPDGARLATEHPAVLAALGHLLPAWPEGIAFAALFELVRTDLGVAFDSAAARAHAEGEFAQLVVRLGATGFVELRSWPAPGASDPGSRPRASHLARLQAARGSDAVTNLLHRTVWLEDAAARRLLQLLDGTHDRAAIEHDMAAWLAAHPEAGRDVPVAEGVTTALAQLARLGLLHRV